MLLYATVTSERASKGQGGKYLEIVVTDSNKEIIARLNIAPYTDSVGDGYKGTLTAADHLYLQVQGEHVAQEYDCTGCGATQQSYKGLCDSCRGIPDEQRGDKQKGKHEGCLENHPNPDCN